MSRCWAIVCALGGVAHADERWPRIPEATSAMAEPYWLTYAAFRNDAFTELDPPIDDQGFTHDNVFALRRQAGVDTFGGSFVHRFITSRTSNDRWDLVELLATHERTWPDLLATEWPHLTTHERVGLALGGNFGGRYIQNGFHALTKTGPTLDQGLQNRYPDDRKAGFVVGGGARAAVGDRVQGYGLLDGQLAIGDTGVTSMQAAIGGEAMARHVGAHVELALTRYHTEDPNLRLPGAYGVGFQFEWRVGVDVHWSRFRLGYEYRANESGSGEPMGLIEFSSRR
ncbi:MAG TPA: hypothetical protein VIV40_13700 [Kofleriaceae bacterium]